MKKIENCKKLTILCDCTQRGNLSTDAWRLRELLPNDVLVCQINASPVSSKEEVYSELSKVRDKKTVVILKSLHEVNSLSVVLVNSMVDTKLDTVPSLDLNEFDLYEVWDEDVVKVEDLTNYVSSYDEAMRGIVSDFMKIQALQEHESEEIQFAEVESSKGEMSVLELIDSRSGKE